MVSLVSALTAVPAETTKANAAAPAIVLRVLLISIDMWIVPPFQISPYYCVMNTRSILAWGRREQVFVDLWF